MMKKYIPHALVFLGLSVAGGIFFIWHAYKSGYEQASADLTPLIHPDEGPMKVEPEHKGGLNVRHQNRLVYNLIGPNAPEPKIENLLKEPEKALENPSPAIADTPIHLEAVPALEIQKAPAKPQIPQVHDTARAEKKPEPKKAQKPLPKIEIKHEKKKAQTDDFEASLTQTLSKIDDISHRNTQKALAKIKKAQTPVVPSPQKTKSKKRIRMQLAVAKDKNVARTLADLRKKLGPTLKGIPLNAVPLDLGKGKGVVHKIYAGPFDRAQVPALCKRLALYGKGCVIPKK